MGLYIIDSNEKEILLDSIEKINTSKEEFDIKSKFEEYYVTYNNFINSLSTTICISWVTSNCDYIAILKTKKILLKRLKDLIKLNQELLLKSNDKDNYIKYAHIFEYLEKRIRSISGVSINTLNDLGRNLCNNFSIENNPILKLERNKEVSYEE